MKPVARRGRPALPKEKRRSHHIGVRVTDDEYQRIRECSIRVAQKPSAWARDVLMLQVELDEQRDVLKDES